MATKQAAKKSAAKQPTRMADANAKWSKVALPSGFRAITSGDYGDEWDYEYQPLLQGVVTGDVREVEAGSGRNKRTSRVITVKSDDDGRSYTVWESASLKAFFDHVQRGMQVALAFHGYRDVGKPQPMKVFEGAFTEEDADAIGEEGDVPPPKTTKRKPVKGKAHTKDF